MINGSASPLCQVIGRAESPKGNDILDGVEFYFGKVGPGETKTYTTRVVVPGGYPTEDARVELKLRDAAGRSLLDRSVGVHTEGAPLPRYAWNWSVDDREYGDGDGIPETGETVALNYAVTNVGDGIGGEVTFNLRKDVSMGKAVELKEARFAAKALAPGSTATGKLSFRVIAQPANNELKFEVSVRDNERFDYATITRAGFYPYFVHTEPVKLSLVEPAPPGHREPPQIEITRAPGTLSAGPTVTLSGVATDDRGVRDVIVYQGQRKLTYAGGGDASTPVPSVPFTASAELGEGNTLFVIAVRDVEGFTTTASIDVARAQPVAATGAPG